MINDYMFFRIMDTLARTRSPNRLAMILGYAYLLPRGEADRVELVIRVGQRCEELGIPVPPARIRPRLRWRRWLMEIPGDEDPWNTDWLIWEISPELRTLPALERLCGTPEQLFWFRANPLYARIRRRYPWLRGLPRAYCEPAVEVRRFCFEEGEAVEVEVTPCGYGHFRLESAMDALMFPEGDDVAFGTMLLGEDLESGELKYQGNVRDADIEILDLCAIPADFVGSKEFEVLTEWIMTTGGNFDAIFGGVFTAYVPRDRSDDHATRRLAGLLDNALAAYSRRCRLGRSR
jgi:hypothetical protein